jgi:hypothetical protein
VVGFPTSMKDLVHHNKGLGTGLQTTTLKMKCMVHASAIRNIHMQITIHSISKICTINERRTRVLSTVIR